MQNHKLHTVQEGGKGKKNHKDIDLQEKVYVCTVNQETCICAMEILHNQ